MTTLEQRYTTYREQLSRAGQAHLLAFWSRLDETQRRQLLDDLDQVDFERCRTLIQQYVVNPPAVPLPAHLEPPTVLPVRPGPGQEELYVRAKAAGEQAIRAGSVAAFTVAGGQGTRLGYDGPKGAFAISPVRRAPLFQLFAESLLGIERRYGMRPRWYVMTSTSNHHATIEFFEKNRYFGLTADDLMFFTQRQMPAFLLDGRIALAEPHRLALSPDGHGGSLRALAESGALMDMRRRGVEYISYFQVDNPLVRTIDPLFIGLHIVAESEASSKAVAKADDFERVGNFVMADGKLAVIEYSDLPESLALARTPDGARRFDAGNIAVHVFSRSFVERLTAAGTKMTLPWHRAEKKITAIAPEGQDLTPAPTNVVKLEMFVFDTLPLAHNPLVLLTLREEEFSPVKNAEGVDSPATARRDMIRRAARWLEYCGVTVPRDATGESALALEISPAYALDADDLRARLKQPPVLSAGQPVLLA